MAQFGVSNCKYGAIPKNGAKTGQVANMAQWCFCKYGAILENWSSCKYGAMVKLQKWRNYGKQVKLQKGALTDFEFPRGGAGGWSAGAQVISPEFPNISHI